MDISVRVYIFYVYKHSGNQTAQVVIRTCVYTYIPIYLCVSICVYMYIFLCNNICIYTLFSLEEERGR